MSKIKVFTSLGEWSKPIFGLDKVHLMKNAITYEYDKTDYVSDRLACEDSPLYILDGLEIDSKVITTEFMDECPIDNDDQYRLIWIFFEKFTGIDLYEAKTLKMRLSTLKEMKTNEGYLASVYDALISEAKVPAAAPADYCLLFKFENE